MVGGESVFLMIPPTLLPRLVVDIVGIRSE